MQTLTVGESLNTQRRVTKRTQTLTEEESQKHDGLLEQACEHSPREVRESGTTHQVVITRRGQQRPQPELKKLKGSSDR